MQIIQMVDQGVLKLPSLPPQKDETTLEVSFNAVQKTHKKSKHLVSQECACSDHVAQYDSFYPSNQIRLYFYSACYTK